MLQEYDLVRLKQPMESPKLGVDVIGTIVMVYDDPPAYEVEFVDDKGSTLAILTLEEDKFTRVSRTTVD